MERATTKNSLQFWKTKLFSDWNAAKSIIYLMETLSFTVRVIEASISLNSE